MCILGNVTIQYKGIMICARGTAVQTKSDNYTTYKHPNDSTHKGGYTIIYYNVYIIMYNTEKSPLVNIQ